MVSLSEKKDESASNGDDLQGLVIVVLTLNESQQLGSLIPALPRDVPVVIVDSGSTDGTTELGAALGCEVCHHKWQGFSAQRNFALDLLKGKFQWVLFIDADERYEAEFFPKMFELLRNDRETDAIYLPQKLVMDGKILNYAPGYPIYHPRLVRTRTARFIPNQSQHGETVEKGLNLKYIDIPYKHYFVGRSLRPWLHKHLELATIESATKDRSIAGVLSTREWLSSLIANGLAKALARFFYHYVISLGFLDGRNGFKYSVMYSWYELTKWLAAESDR